MSTAPRRMKSCKELPRLPSLPLQLLRHVFPSLCLCNCTSLSDASQHIWYIDKFPLPVFSSWLFPGNVQERGGGRHRRQAESRPSFPDGLYHIDWLVKYISYHIKLPLGHAMSSGRNIWVSPNASGKQLQAFASVEKDPIDLLCAACWLKVSAAPGSAALFYPSDILLLEMSSRKKFWRSLIDWLIVVLVWDQTGKTCGCCNPM